MLFTLFYQLLKTWAILKTTIELDYYREFLTPFAFEHFTIDGDFSVECLLRVEKL